MHEPQKVSHRLVLGSAAVALLLTVAIAWITPLAFSGFRVDHSFSGFWLYLSDSGAQWGVGTVIALTAALVAIRQPTTRAKILKPLLFLCGVVVLLSTVAIVNESITKPFVAAHRPYVLMLEEAGLLSGSQFYALSTKPERTVLLQATLDAHPDHPIVRGLDPDIREHWAVETGFSFPSGHSLNAFMFAVILAGLIQRLMPNGRRLVWIPFLWASGICLSRVAVGAHSPLDITVGALAGALIGSTVVMSGVLGRLLPEETLPS